LSSGGGSSVGHRISAAAGINLSGDRAIAQTKMTISQRAFVHVRHLAYVQTCIGFSVKRNMPRLKGTEVEALHGRGRRWLEGGSL
jgi:hypothetical protein